MSVNLSPLRYPGGKNKVYSYIKHLVEINSLTSYIEPFAGGAAIAIKLILRDEVKRIYLNDFDPSIYCFWKSAIFYTDDFVDLITNTPINMDEWHKQVDIQKEKMKLNPSDKNDCLTLGFSTFFLNRTNRSGILKAGVIGGKKQNGNYKMNCRFNKENLIRRIRLIATKRDSIFLYNLDAIQFINQVIKKTRNSLTFFDPPYYDKGPALYTNFYEHQDHVHLANSINENMKNRYWLLTYDTAPQIQNIYEPFHLKFLEYYLNYSVSRPTKGKEFMYFSKKIDAGSYQDYLKVATKKEA
ncbi:DNA adenine methylase [Planococcaceae bacterium Storch 2/2-2]|nr:DNA adenine methylase [Planococcaceae bacterium Storch 2/2-2]